MFTEHTFADHRCEKNETISSIVVLYILERQNLTHSSQRTIDSSRSGVIVSALGRYLLHRESFDATELVSVDAR